MLSLGWTWWFSKEWAGTRNNLAKCLLRYGGSGKTNREGASQCLSFCKCRNCMKNLLEHTTLTLRHDGVTFSARSSKIQVLPTPKRDKFVVFFNLTNTELIAASNSYLQLELLSYQNEHSFT